MNDKLVALKAALAARKKGKAGKKPKHADAENTAEDRAETPTQETAEDKGKSLPAAGQNSAQGLSAPKKPSTSAPDAGKGKAPFYPQLVKFPKGKAGKAVAGKKKPVGAIYFPKAKTRGA